MALLAAQQVTRTGLVATLVAAAVGGDTFSNGGRNMLKVKNASAAAITVTIDSAQSCNQGFDHDIIVSVAASTEKLVGPFPTARFNDDQGKVNVTYSSVVTVTVGVLTL